MVIAKVYLVTLLLVLHDLFYRKIPGKIHPPAYAGGF